MSQMKVRRLWPRNYSAPWKPVRYLKHRQLLQLTERSRRFDADADPVLHLFTDRADLSVDLVARLGSLLKLHLLRDVAVGDQHTWFCVPL